MTEIAIHEDQLGRKVEVVGRPNRIVSLVPSQTELLHDLGLGERVVGITKFCVHPTDWFRTKQRVGGTKRLHFGAIEELQPDLVIANKEENNRDDVERLACEFPVWVSDVQDLRSALEMIRSVADLTAVDPRKMLADIENGFQQLQPIAPELRTLYLIWKDPYMAAGIGTFIDDMMKRCGCANALSESRYPELSEEQIIRLQPELILLSSEPYPFKGKHVQTLQRLLPEATIKLVDGEMFSWYGSRLIEAAAYLNQFTNEIRKGK